MAELYAGARERDREVVERMERDFDKAQRLLVPSLRDWSLTGKVLARLAEKYDYESIGRARMTNDALIALSAGRMGIVVVTANQRDFGRLAEFVSFQWRVASV
jgi:predicted nucleic acid-binding protein